MRHVVLAAAALLGLAASIPPALAQAPVVEVTEAWARATTSSARSGGAFLTLKATGAADRVVSASSPVAEKVELHETIRDGNVMRMREVQHLPVPVGQAVVLQPGSLHIMLIGLVAPLKDGQKFDLNLGFLNGGVVKVTATVKAS